MKLASLATVFACLALPMSAQDSRSPLAPSREALAPTPSPSADGAPGRDLAEIERAVRETFDPNGAFDDVGLWKDPVGTVESAPEPQPLPDQQPASAGGPPNDDCGSPTIIPGNIITYSPPLLNTTTAGIESCEVNESCVADTNNSVYYDYTPDQDGRMFVDTFGSNYDTVLSVWPGCAGGAFFCISPFEVVCNDNFGFGTASQVVLDVVAGTTYKIKVASKGLFQAGGLLDFHLRFLPPNDVCADATVIPGVAYDPPLLSTHNADIDLCGAQESCEFNGVGTSNSVWYRFVAPCDGTIDMNTNGSTYDTVLSVFDGCGVFVGVDLPCDLPNELACDDDSGTGLDSQLEDVPVVGGMEYTIKVADYNLAAGGGYLDFNFVFDGATSPTAELTSLSDFECLCGDATAIVGEASTGGDSYAGWELDYRLVAGGDWVTIASGTDPVEAATLAAWNTTGLAQGYALVRLTVENACGQTSADTKVVFLDKGFDLLDLTGPPDLSAVAGTACLGGTVVDTCLDEYRVEYRPLGGGGWTTIVTGSTNVRAASLGGWDTTVIPDGVYELRLTGTDTCGNTAEDVDLILVDNTPPVVAFAAPAACASVSGTVSVVGTASDVLLDSWELDVSGGDLSGWVPIASGSSSVVGAQLGSWATSGLPGCGYTLRLTAYDNSVVDCCERQKSEAFLTVRTDCPSVIEVQPGQNP